MSRAYYKAAKHISTIKNTHVYKAIELFSPREQHLAQDFEDLFHNDCPILRYGDWFRGDREAVRQERTIALLFMHYMQKEGDDHGKTSI